MGSTGNSETFLL
jgi:hypothetical protein